MKLQDYTTEELRAELKRRTDLVKAEKAKVKLNTELANERAEAVKQYLENRAVGGEAGQAAIITVE